MNRTSTHQWSARAGVVPSLGIAVLSKFTCSLCLTAYAGVLSSLGVVLLSTDRGLLIFTAVLVALNLLSLGWSTWRHKHWGPLAWHSSDRRCCSLAASGPRRRQSSTAGPYSCWLPPDGTSGPHASPSARLYRSAAFTCPSCDSREYAGRQVVDNLPDLGPALLLSKHHLACHGTHSMQSAKSPAEPRLVDPQPQVRNRLASTLGLAPTGADHARGCQARHADSKRAGLEHADLLVKIPPMRGSLIHRLTASLVTLCFALFSVEAAVADVHDADGSPPSVSQDAHDGQLPVPSNDGTQPQNAPGERGHPVHVCHCTHAHTAGSVAARVTVSLTPVHGFTPYLVPTQHSPSRAQEPLVPPPIA